MITTVSTVKDDVARLQRWIDRNMAAGVDRMVIFVDDRDDAQTDALLNARPGVVAVGAGTWWGDEYPARLNARQRINANAALGVVRENDPQGWMFHIDGDEVLHLDKERLLTLADDIEAVQLSPLEALSQWEWPNDEVTVFKRLLADDELNLLHLLGMLERPDNNVYFRGHTAGKAGLRVSSDAWLDIHRVVDDQRTPVAMHRADWLQVLHYESHTPEEFVRKWTNHTTSGHRLTARPDRRRLASAMKAEAWGRWPAEVAHQVRRELFAATALDDRDGLERLGLLVSPVMPEHLAVPSLSDPHLERIQEELAALATTDKSRFRLGDADASGDSPPRPHRQSEETFMSDPTLAAQVAPTGTLRVVINLGNPVLAQGTAGDPRGVTVAIAHELATWLGVPLEIECVDAARDSYAAIVEGRADLCFLANEPAREEGVAFTGPYVLIEGVYVTGTDSPLRSSDEVDRDGVRIGVREGSAYDLFLTRSLEHAEIVRAKEATDVYEERGLEVAAGVRQPMADYVAATGRRILEPPFMEIQQAVGVPRRLDHAAVAAVTAKVEELKASGFVHDELARSGVEATVAPPA